MAHSTKQGQQLLNGFKRLTRFDKGLGAQLPEAYKKFWREWKVQQPAAVHYVPKEEGWQRDELTGELKLVQNVPLPLIDPPESHKGIWGGEAVIKGFQKRDRLSRRVPHFWVPVLRRSVVHSQVLNDYMSLVVTDRTIEKIHECRGFDHYLLKHPACDLRSLLALTLKRKILQELLRGCPSHPNAAERERVLQEFKCYLDGYTAEEIEWYGYSYEQAIKKLLAQLRAESPIVPHKVQLRMKLIEQLRQAGILEAGGVVGPETSDKPTAASVSTENDANIEAITKLESSASTSSSTSSSWLSKINPFGKKQET